MGRVSRFADQTTMMLEGAQHGWCRRRRIQQSFHEPDLFSGRKADDLFVLYRLARGLFCRRDDKLADRAALNLGGPPHDRQRVRRGAGLDPFRTGLELGQITMPTSIVLLLSGG